MAQAFVARLMIVHIDAETSKDSLNLKFAVLEHLTTLLMCVLTMLLKRRQHVWHTCTISIIISPALRKRIKLAWSLTLETSS